MTANHTTDAMAAVARVLADGDRRRATRAVHAWHIALRPYERRLVREAAVMGFILGERHGWHTATMPGTARHADGVFPRDMDIVQDVIEHCDATSDLYPYLHDACNGVRRRITRKRLWPGETR